MCGAPVPFIISNNSKQYLQDVCITNLCAYSTYVHRFSERTEVLRVGSAKLKYVPVYRKWTFIYLYLNSMGGSPGELSEELVTQEKRKKGWRMNCDVDEATEGLENEL